MSDINQLKRAVVELENGVQWVKALTEVGELKEETREQIQQLIDAADKLQKQQEQAQITAKISSEEGRQQQANILNSLTDNLSEMRNVSKQQAESAEEAVSQVKKLDQNLRQTAVENTEKMLTSQAESSRAASDQIIASLSQQFKENTESLNRQLQAYSDVLEQTSKKLRRRIALNRWLTLGYAVIIIAMLVLFKFVF